MPEKGTLKKDKAQSLINYNSKFYIKQVMQGILSDIKKNFCKTLIVNL